MRRILLPLLVLIGIPLLWALNLRRAAGWYYTAQGLSDLRAGIKLHERIQGSAASTMSTTPTTADQVLAQLQLDEKLVFTRMDAAFERARRFHGNNPFPKLFMGMSRLLRGQQAQGEELIDSFLSCYDGDVNLPLSLWRNYDGTGPSPFTNISLSTLRLSPYSAILAAWFALHAGDLPSCRNLLYDARSAKQLCWEYHALLGLTAAAEGKIDEAFSSLKQARALSFSNNRIKNFAFAFDPFDCKLTPISSGVELKRGAWRGTVELFGRPSPRRSAELLYNLTVLNFVRKDWHRALFLTEIIQKSVAGALRTKEAMPELERMAYPLAYEAAVRNNAEAYGLDPALILAVMREESKFKVKARSGAAASGLMQLTPETARWICGRLKRRYDEKVLTDTVANIQLGSWFLSYLKGKFAEKTYKIEWVLAGYNAGFGNAERWYLRWKARGKKSHPLRYIAYKETKDYVVKVRAAQKAYRELYGADLKTP